MPVSLIHNSYDYDVIIAGAGPAGCACALALRTSGLRIALIDKAVFPRDKICGDAIPGRAARVLRDIDPAFEQELQAFPHKYDTRSATMHYKGKAVTFNWVLSAYTCPRLQFDDLLLSMVKRHTNTSVYEGVSVASVAAGEQGVAVQLQGRSALSAAVIIGADGAQSVVARQLAGNPLRRQHHIGSVRAYYSNVTIADVNNVEVFFDRRLLPSYLWIFPLPGNITNVGFGMLSSEVAKRKIDIKKTFYRFIDSSPHLREKFSCAAQVSRLEGFSLPLGSAPWVRSGNRFLLAGDAASLVDPITGDGIGNAMLSGHLAAKQVMRSFTAGDFGSAFNLQYDEALRTRLYREMQTHYRAQRLLSRFPALLDGIFLACRSNHLKSLIQRGL